jgi:hypothetical protein
VRPTTVTVKRRAAGPMLQAKWAAPYPAHLHPDKIAVPPQSRPI